MQLILASASPRRRELLQLAGYTFAVRVSQAEEHIEKGLPLGDAVAQLARVKALAVPRGADEVILAADTIVELDGRILGKPRDRADAAAMLTQLSGRDHRVFTGVYIAGETIGANTLTETLFYSETTVRFYPLSPSDIDAYLDTGEPFDKAGAYGIQGRGCVLVESLQGDYFNVMGLPISRVAQALRPFGILPNK